MRATVTRWVLSLVLLGGTAIGVYLTAHHDSQLYGDRAFKLENCPQTETVDCEAVNTSAWSEVAGTPIASLAVPVYLLVLGLVWGGRSRPAYLSYAFSIGLAATAASMVLFYVSKVKVGFLCLWCMRLYGVNLAIPVLVAVVAERWPRELTAETIAHLGRWPRPLRFTTAAWLALLALTVGGERLYRGHIHEAARLRAANPAVLASSSPQPSAIPGAPTAALADPTTQVPYELPAPLRRIFPEPGRFRGEVLDLQARLGSGTPVALLYWAPGFKWSEQALVEIGGALAQRWPAIEAYAVAGRRADERDEEIYETYGLLPVPPGLPLLVDDGFAVAKALHAEEVPSLVLFDGRGKLVTSGIKDLSQRLIETEGAVLPAAELLTRLASATDAPTIRNKYPYFPAMKLDRSCAPGFTLERFGTDEDFTFRPTGGRPTMLLFWSATCKHCQLEIPQLVRWMESHPDAIDVVSITRVPPDEPGKASRRSVTTDYVRRTGITFPVLDDWGGAVSDRYGVVSTPTSIFVSPDGAIVDEWFFAHPDGFDAAMERSLAKMRVATACTAPAPAPEARLALSVSDAQGARHELTSLIDRPTVVHLWATWCQPCLAELPALMMFKQRVEREGLARVVFVSVEPAQAAPTIAAFSQRVGFGFQSYLAPSGGIADVIELSYHVPRSYLVAPGGKLLDILHGKQEWKDPVFQESVLSRFRNAS